MSGHEITVVIPAYRSEATIERAINSVLVQPGVTPRIIVVVDGDFDRTAEIAGAFDGVQVLKNERNLGSQATRNRGLEAVTSDYVTFLDADDYIEGKLYPGMVTALSQSEGGFVLSPWSWEVIGKSIRRHDRRGDELWSNGPLIEDLVLGWLIHGGAQSGAMGWRTEALRAIGGWNMEIDRSQDFEVGLRSLIAGLKATSSSQGRAVYVHHKSPHRITQVKHALGLESHKKILDMAEEYARSATDPSRIRYAIGVRYYQIASRCFLEGSLAEGRQALALARDAGFKGHTGSRGHNAVSRLFGLELKQRFSKIAHCGIEWLINPHS